MSLYKFEVGDVVRCIANDYPCEVGDIHTITERHIGPCTGQRRYGLKGVMCTVYEDSFELAEEPPAPTFAEQVAAVSENAARCIETPPDAVFRPHHYARFVIEPATFINANALPYNIGNVIKYSCRYDAKNGSEDLRKAIRYLEMQIEVLDRQDRVAAGEAAKDVWKDVL